MLNKYYQPNLNHLIKATQPFECIDFKGHPPSFETSILSTIVDEYSWFPFAYPVRDISTTTTDKNV